MILMFDLFKKYHAEGREFAFVREELPFYARAYGREPVAMCYNAVGRRA